MELGEVVNPHYAFPVVGVILCVLLVFAFGFKSPAQPPSFDGLEEEKKNIPKKRSKSAKSKENKTKAQQNGKVGGGSPTAKQLPESKLIANDVANSVIMDKQNSKIESKSKKSRSTANPSRQKLEQTGLLKNRIVTNSEDNTEGEWVQQLSKKERKHRRKEEVANACVIIETDKSSDNSTWDEHQNIAELSSGSQVSTPLKGSPKQDLNTKCNGMQQLNQDVEVQKNQKKKSKKENAISQTEISSMPAKYEELQKENKEIETEQYNEIPNTSIEIYNEVVEENSGAEEKSKKKKSKKKIQDASPSSGKSSSNEDFPTKKLLEDTIESKKSSFKIVESSVADIEVAENSTNIKDLQSSKLKPDTKNDVMTLTESGSNVVFDELADMWQDAKSQRKKKKARRDQ